MRFRLLGPLQMAAGSGWATIRASQQRAVLAVLLLEADQVVTLDRLVDEVWGQRPPATAPNTMQAYVMRLRRALGDPHGRQLVTRSAGYQMRVEDGDLDVPVFDRLTTAGHGYLAAGRWEPAVAQLAEALALWHGPAMSDVPATPTVTMEAARLEQRRLTVLEARLDAELELGRHATVAMKLERLVAEHSLREHFRGQLMLALYRCGRRADALSVFRQGRDLLVDELGIEPAPALRDLQQAILNDDNDDLETTAQIGTVRTTV